MAEWTADEMMTVAAARRLVGAGDRGGAPLAPAFVDRLDFRTSVPGRGPTAVITDLGVLEGDPTDRELVLTSVHPGATVDGVRAATGWDLRVAPGVAVTPSPHARRAGRAPAHDRGPPPVTGPGGRSIDISLGRPTERRARR